MNKRQPVPLVVAAASGFSFDTPPAIGYTAKPQTRIITMNLNTLRDQVHGLAKDKGWHDDTMSVIDYMAKATANLHGETSELWEAARRGELNKQCDKACALTCMEEELADIIIRALDTAGAMGVDIEAAVSAKHFYNATRPHRHGGKLA